MSTEYKAKVGVVSCKSLQDWIYDEIHDGGIDIGYEAAREEYVRSNLDDELSEDEMEDEIDRLQEAFSDMGDSGDTHIIFGDWKKNSEGLYEEDREGPKGFAAEFTSGSLGDIVWVNWSKTISSARETSWCCQFKREGEPQELCGDLDSKEEGYFDTYDLPAEFYRPAEE